MNKFSYKTRVIKEYKRVIRNGMRMKSRHSGEDVEKVSEKDFMEFLNFSIEALEKQVPKKVIPYEKKLNDFLVQGYLEKGKIKKWNECPSCRKHVYKELFCRRCGQKLDWSEVDE